MRTALPLRKKLNYEVSDQETSFALVTVGMAFALFLLAIAACIPINPDVFSTEYDYLRIMTSP